MTKMSTKGSGCSVIQYQLQLNFLKGREKMETSWAQQMAISTLTLLETMRKMC